MTLIDLLGADSSNDKLSNEEKFIIEYRVPTPVKRKETSNVIMKALYFSTDPSKLIAMADGRPFCRHHPAGQYSRPTFITSASAHTTGDKVVIAELVLDMVVVELMMRVFVSSYIDVDEVAFISFEI